MHVPIFTIVTENSDTVHTDVVDDVKATVRFELEVAVTVNDIKEKDRLLGFVNVIACDPLVTKKVFSYGAAGYQFSLPPWLEINVHDPTANVLKLYFVESALRTGLSTLHTFGVNDSIATSSLESVVV